MPKKKDAKTVTHVTKKSEKSQTLSVGRGGKRVGAGRPKGTGKYGCETKAVRLPIHLIEEVQAYVQRKLKKESLSLT